MTTSSTHTCRTADARRFSLKHARWTESALLLMWLIAVACGFYVLIDYSTAPGVSRPPLNSWPAQTSLARSITEPTLLMFLHPHCPCSRASIEELNRSLAQINRPIRASIVFVRPSEMPSSWHETDLWRSARSIALAQIIEDVDGVEARRFGAVTSGATYVFDPSGTLRFAGGITAARGHVGDNAAQAAVVDALLQRSSGSRQFPVFGCSLVEPIESGTCKDVTCCK